MSSLQSSWLQSSTALSSHSSSCNFCQIYLHSNMTGLWSNFIFPLKNQGCFMLVFGAQQLPQSAEIVPMSFSCRNRKQAQNPQQTLSQRQEHHAFPGFSSPHYWPVVVRKWILLAKWPWGDGVSVSSQKKHPASHGHCSRQTDCSRAHISSSTCVKTHLLSISQQLLWSETHYNRIKNEGCLLNGLVMPPVRRTSW